MSSSRNRPPKPPELTEELFDDYLAALKLAAQYGHYWEMDHPDGSVYVFAAHLVQLLRETGRC